MGNDPAGGSFGLIKGSQRAREEYIYLIFMYAWFTFILQNLLLKICHGHSPRGTIVKISTNNHCFSENLVYAT